MPSEALRHHITRLPASPEGAAALARLSEGARQQGQESELGALLADGALSDFLASALGDSPFLLNLAARDIPRLVSILDAPPGAPVAREIETIGHADCATRAEAMTALRKARQTVALSLGLADLARAVPLDTITRCLSDFADAACSAALRFALADAVRQGKWRGGPADASGFFLLAMGKQGARELNYSSDIDLIALFEPEPAIAAGVEDPTTFWVKIVRMMVTLLQERTADGYVFRTDLRLRPDPAATPVAISIPAALSYYESLGQNWERAALVKARPCAGDIQVGSSFLKEIAPFIWRKYLDFAAIADIHSIKRQVHAHRGHGTVRIAGHDIKRGRGGIREIEFFVQTQQLIAGGRDRELRGLETRRMLAALAERSWIDETARAELDHAYVYLRELEHRLQIVRDEQTHLLPEKADELARIARLMGFEDTASFEQATREILECVAGRYSELFEGAPELSGSAGNLVFTGGDDDPETIRTLGEMGFQDPAHVTHTVRAWHFGRFPATRSTRAREGLTELTPALLAALARGGNPDAALRTFDALLKGLPAGAQLFSLLANKPDLLDLLAAVLGAAPRLAAMFVKRPHIVDALVEPAFLEEAGDRETYMAGLAASLAEATGYEAALDRARIFAAEHRFLISVNLLTGKLGAAAAGRAFSDLAEAVVATLHARTEEEFARQHGAVPGGRSAILAFGRLGSREMTAGSDLDLIVIYQHDQDATASDGKRPLAPSQYYTRLTQRLVAALSAPTAEGVAYPVDLRLRPSGRAGPLASHVDAFAHYQMEEAWTWEHMAMSRGRPVAGDPALCGDVSAIIGRLVDKARDRKALAADIASMRSRVESERRASGFFDVKLAPGGLMDCEFAAQFLVLAGLGRIEGEQTGDILARAVAENAVGEGDGALLCGSVALQTVLLQATRIADDKLPDPDSLPDGLRRLFVTLAAHALDEACAAAGPEAGVLPVGLDFDKLRAALPAIQQRTRAAFERVVGPVGADAAATRPA